MEYEQLPESVIERARLLERILISAATTGVGPSDEKTYAALRTALIQDPSIKTLVPTYIRTCRDLSTFRSYTQQIDKQWAPRRAHITNSLNPLFDHFEGINRHPVDATASDVIQQFDSVGISDIWQKSLERRHKDPEGAITAARTLLETVCKHILEEANQSHEGDDLPALYAKTAAVMNLAPSQHTETAFKRILGGATSVVEGLGSLRNKIGDAHGQGKGGVRPSPRHAHLAVNMAGTMATFLIETWKTRPN